MLKITIKGVSANGEVVDQMFEGDLVNVFVLKDMGNSAECEGCTIGRSSTEAVARAIISNLLKVVKNDKGERRLLKLAMVLILNRLAELETERAAGASAGTGSQEKGKLW